MPDDELSDQAGDNAASEGDPTSAAPTAEGAPGAPLQPHGDPLLASAQGENDGDNGSRHGWAATTGIGEAGTADRDDSDAEAEDADDRDS